MAQEYLVIKNKNLSELELSQYLTPSAKETIQRWISKNNPDQFLKSVYFTLRDLHTTIKNFEPSKNNHSIWYKQKMADRNVPRFDKIISSAKEETRLQTVDSEVRRGHRTYNYNRYEQFEFLRGLVEQS